MAQGSLKLSVLLEAVTTAFNQGIGTARTNYGAAMTGIKADSESTSAAGKAAGESLLAALNVRSSGAIKAELAGIIAQLASFRNSAGAPADEVNRVTQAAQVKIAALRQELSGIAPAASSGGVSLASMGRELLAVAGVAGGLAGVAAGLKAIVDTALDFQRVNKQLEYAVGGTKAAKAEFEFISAAARGMGIDVLTAAEGYAKLASATKGTALEGQATRDVFIGVAQAAATMGLSAEATNGTFLAIAQIASKGRVQMEELRGQLGERLPPALKIAADSLGVTTAQLEKLVEKGLDADVFITAFGPALQKSFSAEAAKNVGTLGGSIANLKNDFRDLLKYLGDSGVTAGVTSVFGELSTVIKSIQTSLKGVDPTTLNAVVETLRQLYNVGKVTFSALISAVGDVNNLLNSLLSGVTGVSAALTGTAKKGAEDVGLLTRSMQGISILVGLIADGVYGIRIAFTAVTGATQGYFSAVALGLSKVTFGKLSEELKEVSKNLQAASKDSYASAEELLLKFESSAKRAADAAVDNAQTSSTKVAAAYTGAAKEASAAQGQIADAVAAGSIATVAGATAAVQGLKFVGAEALATATRMRDLGDGGSSALGSVGVAAEAAKVKIQVFQGALGQVIVEATKASDNVKEAFTSLATTLGVTLPPSIQNVGQMGLALAATAVASERVGKQLGQELPAALAGLNAVDLSAFREAFIGGLEKAGASAEVLRARVIDVDGAIAKLLGADLGAAQTGLTQVFKDNVANLDALLGRLRQLAKTGVDTGLLVRDALNGMVDKAKNVAEVQAIIDRIQLMGKAGELSARLVAEGLEKARNKIDDLKPGVNSVAEAFRTFGFQTREEARLMAEKYLQAFLIMKESGTATAEQLTAAWKKYTESAILGQAGLAATAAQAFAQLGLKTREELAATARETQQAFTLIEGSGQATKEVLRQAFIQYATAAIAANNGVVNSFLQIKAAALGLKIDVDDTGKANIVVLTRLEERLDNVNTSYKDLQTQAKEAGNVGVQAADQTASALDRQAAAAGRAEAATAKAGAAAGGDGGSKPRKGAFDGDVEGIASGRGGVSGGVSGGTGGFPEPVELYAAAKSLGGSDALARRMQSQARRFYDEVYLGEGNVKFFSWKKFEDFVANEVNRERQSVAQGGSESPGSSGIGRGGGGAGGGQGTYQPPTVPGFKPPPLQILPPGVTLPPGTPGYTPPALVDLPPGYTPPPGAPPGYVPPGYKAPPLATLPPGYRPPAPGGGLGVPNPVKGGGGDVGKTITVKFVGPGGKEVSATLAADDETDFLRLLHRAKGLA